MGTGPKSGVRVDEGRKWSSPCRRRPFTRDSGDIGKGGVKTTLIPVGLIRDLSRPD